MTTTVSVEGTMSWVRSRGVGITCNCQTKRVSVASMIAIPCPTPRQGARTESGATSNLAKQILESFYNFLTKSISLFILQDVFIANVCANKTLSAFGFLKKTTQHNLLSMLILFKCPRKYAAPVLCV